ncbi:2-C-methyl-D-erythritol 2,4-cyclodiphosphate synthase [Porphyromonas circumdentaria]|uniref:2-C-methyl-D-erythritol 2,4-cyclodiphosphate synthase n=1 Tax=Porphyromonas circumdentaria TaxID=29524 RepID=UPI0026DB755C|nr:2-C-methyl-D-erythritol 2,4-cyclodiphosphate synthase [Porphyromonas circumdentaria]MDO4722766.1 2-C-methyl-D-erythritol 2,4-cyclodiphosphate synthase [Porphyromonas circumdentaria]
MNVPFSVGIGYDVHRLASGIPLKICGVEIDYEMGLEAHSDGDVGLHALSDALLGAAALGDIGYHFPPSDNTYKGIDSKVLLEKVVALLHKEQWGIGNVDIVIIAQAPKLAPYITSMREILSRILGEGVQVSVKATTTEHLGFTGRKEGIAALATVLLYKDSNQQ